MKKLLRLSRKKELLKSCWKIVVIEHDIFGIHQNGLLSLSLLRYH